jgi:tight adherence protein C
MMTRDQQLLVCLAAVFALGFYAVYSLLRREDVDRVKDRLQAGTGAPPESPLESGAPGTNTVPAALSRLSEAVGRPLEPKDPEQRSALRRRLGHAGLYSATAVPLFLGAKIIAFAGGLAGAYAAAELTGFADQSLLACTLGGAIGYFLPTLWLGLRTRAEQKALEHGLPDALDLLVVCVESGLTLDAAMQRVGKEIALPHPSLAREMGITHVEMQMGQPRADAMRNLARRTGSAALKSLTAILIQADRFGTSVAQALRVYSDSLRTKRQYAAEEMAAKASVKMTIPLVLCIFPSIMIVAGGPAFIKFMSIKL